MAPVDRVIFFHLELFVNYRSMIAALGAGVMLAGCSLTGISARTGGGDLSRDASRGEKWHVIPLLNVASPDAIAVNDAGDLYFLQVRGGRTARVLLTNGTVKTIASKLQARGIGAYRNVAYIANTGSNSVERVSLSGKTTQFGSDWQYPYAVATDATGGVYVLETSQIVVYKKSKLAQEIPVPSNCNAGGLGIDGERNLYISCDVQKEVLRIQPDGTTATVCNGWVSPRTITSDAAGNVYVADDSEKELRECTVGGILKTIATDAPISRITGLTSKGNDLYSAAADKRELYKLTPP
jgi:hypothetical protein